MYLRLRRTGDQFDQDNSNIVQFFQLLKKDDRNKQMVYYQAGIGTSSKHFVTPIGTALSKTVDMAIAHGLRDHVTDGYEFLMQNYIEGDKIAMFGFSRGAYTARALAGMLHKVGLLPPCNYQQVPFAYHMYKRDDKEGWEMSNGFKQAFSIDVEINFMGLFDTVNSVGLVPRELPFAKSNYVVRTFRHAVALDERRAKFKANLWGRISDEDAALAAPKREDYQSRKKREKLRRQAEEQQKATLYGYSAGMVGSVSIFLYLKASIDSSSSEVWFSGAHTDVGGGSVKNGERYSLARISMRWMVRQCFKCNTGIMFHTNLLEDIGLSPETLWPKVLPRPPPIMSLDDIPAAMEPREPFISEEVEDLKDALAPIYDQLKLNWWWWILELIPAKQVSAVVESVNLGGPRVIKNQKREGVNVHRTVQIRINAKKDIKGKKFSYYPSAWLKMKWVRWIGGSE
ncbi:hypothetical protein BDV93DRAFT_453718 [Ceratobasidium sp. AG-I]|nr:hypothetical protein BDV93DRAFT_453718 [Ceratobasidium sp. AG-I]